MTGTLIAVILASLATSAAPASPPLPPPKPHMHYKIVTGPSGRLADKTLAGRLRAACDLAKAIADKTKDQHDRFLAFDISLLRQVACEKQ